MLNGNEKSYSPQSYAPQHSPPNNNPHSNNSNNKSAYNLLPNQSNSFLQEVNFCPDNTQKAACLALFTAPQQNQSMSLFG